MTNQGDRHASFRALSGTTGTYNDDSYAAFIAGGATVGNTYNGAMIEWLQSVTGSSDTEINGLKQLFAEQQGASSWSELGTFFIPPPVAGYIMWLDGQDGDNTIILNGSKVAEWQDKSGQGNNLSMSTELNQPTYTASGINGKPSLVFNGDNTVLKLSGFATGTLSQPILLFIVVHFTSLTPFDKFTDGYGGTNRLLSGYSYGGGRLIITMADNLITGTNVVTTNTPYVIGEVFNTSSSKIIVNGSTVASGDIGAGTVIGLTLGAIYYTATGIDGMIGEVVMYNSMLSDSEIQSVEEYLGNKWGITLA